jgi:DNA-binding PadR family transcriptional regulator
MEWEHFTANIGTFPSSVFGIWDFKPASVYQAAQRDEQKQFLPKSAKTQKALRSKTTKGFWFFLFYQH